jgi:hypothetical protein
MSAVPATEVRPPSRPSDETGIRLSEHPRARRHISQAKGWGGLAGFALVGFLSLQAGVPFFETGMRALLAGAAGFALGWGCAVLAWRHLAVAEMKVAEQRARERRSRAADAGRRAQAALDAHQAERDAARNS